MVQAFRGPGEDVPWAQSVVCVCGSERERERERVRVAHIWGETLLLAI